MRKAEMFDLIQKKRKPLRKEKKRETTATYIK